MSDMSNASNEGAAPAVAEVLTKVITYLEENLDEKPSAPIAGTSHLVKDIKLDSIQSFEMVADLEDHYGISIPSEVFENVQTVEDVAREIAQIMANGAAS